ncbi:MAG TPA: tetratricopeptide repeat protein [Vicinamibacterales bacterium]|nr:tetratricopeptide repeat protein [Vicinamibacterales bacterium]
MAAVVASCARGPQRPALEPLVLPDLSAAAPAVRERITAQYSIAQQKTSNPATSLSDLADADGAFGRLLLASEHFDAAAVALEDARRLAPSDPRWPYYLAHVRRYQHDPAAAAEGFRAVLRLRAGDVPSLVWLGEMELAQGHADAATAAFAQARARAVQSAAALYGLGRAALARRAYRQAVDNLSEALRLAPQAARVHYPLGLAYQAMGDRARADEEFAQRGDAEPLPADPLMAQLGTLLDDAPAHERRAASSMEQRQWSAAISELRTAVSLAPDRADDHLNLGTALYMNGDVNGAIAEWRTAATLSPSLAQAHYFLGVVLGSRGDDAGAVAELTSAVAGSQVPDGARLELANALRRVGRPAEAVPQYEQLLEHERGNAAAWFGDAMALVQLRRYRAARDRLETAAKQLPDDAGLEHALARLLAASPDASARNGERAVTIARALLTKTRSLAVGETLAMALAETGRFDEAVALQRQILAAAEKAGQTDVASRVSANLRRYEQRAPCREPWSADDPVFHPRPSGLPGHAG